MFARLWSCRLPWYRLAGSQLNGTLGLTPPLLATNESEGNASNMSQYRHAAPATHRLSRPLTPISVRPVPHPTLISIPQHICIYYVVCRHAEASVEECPATSKQ